VLSVGLLRNPNEDQDNLSFTFRCCFAGHFECLAYLLEHGCPVDDLLLGVAMEKGQLPSVELLVRHGLPRNRPYHHRANGPETGSYQRDCLRHIVASGCAIHQGTLIWSAFQGDVDSVRLLHEGGVPLWVRAWALEVDPGDGPFGFEMLPGLHHMSHAEQHNLIVVPQTSEAGAHMGKVLRYAACMGAPVTPRMEEMLRADRAGTRAVLLSFHVAARLSQGKGSPTQRAHVGPHVAHHVAAVMAQMPPELIDKVLVHADLEIPESVRRIVPQQPCVRVQLKGPDELCGTEMEEYAIPASFHS
jgi:hypothetical protein